MTSNSVNKMTANRRCRSVSAPFGYYCSQMQCRLNLLKGNGAISKAERRMSDETLYRKLTPAKPYGGIPLHVSKSEPSRSSSFIERSSSSKSYRSSSQGTYLPSTTDTHRSFHLKLSSTPVMQLPRLGACQHTEHRILTEEELRYLYPNSKPKDLYCINIQGRQFSKIDRSLMAVCTNVIAIDAGENCLDLESFRCFANLKELLLPLNNIRQINITEPEFNTLTVLDLSCNYISPTAVFLLGDLFNLKMLDLSCNNLQHLPIGLAPGSFSSLDTLILDNNSITDESNFKSLSRLQSLKTLSLKNNEITFLPFIETRMTQNLIHEEMEILCGFREELSPVYGPLGDSVKRKPKSSWCQKPHTYFRDDKNYLLPFPQLQQLNLMNNKIREVEAVYAVKTWCRMEELVIAGNRIASLSSRHLDKIKGYLVPSFNIKHVQFSHRIYDSRMDPFHKEGLIKKLIGPWKRDDEFCDCHEITLYPTAGTDFNLDVKSAPLKGIKSLPLPGLRVCEFKPHHHHDRELQPNFRHKPRSKFQLKSEIVAQKWREIGDHVAPSTLPSTIRAAKIAFQRTLLNDWKQQLASIAHTSIVTTTATTSVEDNGEFSTNLHLDLLTKNN